MEQKSRACPQLSQGYCGGLRIDLGSSVGQLAEHQRRTQERVWPPSPWASHSTFPPSYKTEPFYPPGPTQSCMGFCLQCSLTILSMNSSYTSFEAQPHVTYSVKPSLITSSPWAQSALLCASLVFRTPLPLDNLFYYGP